MVSRSFTSGCAEAGIGGAVVAGFGSTSFATAAPASRVREATVCPAATAAAPAAPMTPVMTKKRRREGVAGDCPDSVLPPSASPLLRVGCPLLRVGCPAPAAMRRRNTSRPSASPMSVGMMSTTLDSARMRMTRTGTSPAADRSTVAIRRRRNASRPMRPPSTRAPRPVVRIRKSLSLCPSRSMTGLMRPAGASGMIVWPSASRGADGGPKARAMRSAALNRTRVATTPARAARSGVLMYEYSEQKAIRMGGPGAKIRRCASFHSPNYQ